MSSLPESSTVAFRAKMGKMKLAILNKSRLTMHAVTYLGNKASSNLECASGKHLVQFVRKATIGMLFRLFVRCRTI